MKKLYLILFLLFLVSPIFCYVPYIHLENHSPEQIFNYDIEEYVKIELSKTDNEKRKQKIIDKYGGYGKRFETKEDFLKAVKPVYENALQSKDTYNNTADTIETIVMVAV